MHQLLGMGAGFYYLQISLNLTQYRGAVGTFNIRKRIFQRSRKAFSFLNYVNINSFQNYPFSTFISIAFLLLKLRMKLFALFLFLMSFSLKTYFWLQSLLVLLSGHVEINSDLTRTLKATLLISHWNLNSIYAHNYVKVFFLRAHLVFHKLDIICLSETYLNSSNSPDDEKWKNLDTIQCALTTRLTVNVEEYAYTIKTTCPHELSS